MSESDWLERINFDFEALRDGKALPENEDAPQEVYQTLEVARRLVQADFSAESRVRESLRARLVARPPARRWSWSKPGLARFLSPAQAAALAGVILILIIALAFALNSLLSQPVLTPVQTAYQTSSTTPTEGRTPTPTPQANTQPLAIDTSPGSQTGMPMEFPLPPPTAPPRVEYMMPPGD